MYRQVRLRIGFVLLFVLSYCHLQAQVTNSAQLDYEAAIKVLRDGAYKEALDKLNQLERAGFKDKGFYRYRGEAKFELEDFQGAAEDLDKVRLTSDDPKVFGMLGICKYQQHEWEAAKYFLLKAIPNGFKHSKGHLYLGYLYYEGYEHPQCVEQLNAAEKGGEKEIKLFQYRGVAAYHAGDKQLAISDLTKVVKARKAELKTYEVLGLAYATDDKRTFALPFLNKADSMKSMDSKVYFELGMCLDADKKFDRAIDAYSRAIELNYPGTAVYTARGKSKISAGKVKESLVDFDQVVKMKPERADGYRDRVEASVRLNDWAKVVTDLVLTQALGSPSTDDYALLAVAKFNLKNFQGALEDVNNAIIKGAENYSVNGKKHSIYFLQGQCLVANKQFEAAAAALEKAEAQGEHTDDMYLERARAYVGMRKYEKAINDLEMAQKNNSKDANLFYNSAVIKEEIGDVGAAVLDYTQAIKLNPKDALAYYGRGNGKAKKGNLSEALADLDEAISLDGTNAAFFKSRGNVYYQLKNKDKACFDWRKAVEYGDEKARFSIDQYCKK